MLSMKVLVVFFALIAFTQSQTRNSCSGNGIDLCEVTKVLGSLQVKISLINLVLKLQNILGGVVAGGVCTLGQLIPVQVCLPICSVVQALTELEVDVNVIQLLIVQIGADSPDCGGLGGGIF